MASGAGPTLTDVDGNTYIDLIGNFTSLVHGNAYPPIVEAAHSAAGSGTAWPASNESSVALGELLVERLRSVELLRFTNSGSEATMLALEIARAATGRRKVLMAARGYHGSHGAFEAGTFGHEGPETLLAPFGDAEAFAAVLSEHGSDVACVVLEPVLGSGGVVEAGPEFFAQVQAATARAGAVFVLDEVITFRLSTGGAQALLDVTPDLTAMGKIIGGGFPVGAVGGRADLMALTDPMGEPKVHHSGTFNGNPVTTAAGIVSVQHLTSDAIGTMDTLTARFETSLVDAGEVPLSTRRVGSLLQVVFDDERAVPLFHLAALNHGLFFAARGLLALSTVVDEPLVDEAAERAAAALADVAKELN